MENTRDTPSLLPPSPSIKTSSELALAHTTSQGPSKNLRLLFSITPQDGKLGLSITDDLRIIFIYPRGAASQTPLQLNDRLTAINSTPLDNITCFKVSQMLQQASVPISLEIERRANSTSTSRKLKRKLNTSKSPSIREHQKLQKELKQVQEEKQTLEEQNSKFRARVQELMIKRDKIKLKAEEKIAQALEKAAVEIKTAQQTVFNSSIQERMNYQIPDLRQQDELKSQVTLLQNKVAKYNEREEVRQREQQQERRYEEANAKRDLEQNVLPKLRQLVLAELTHLVSQTAASPSSMISIQYTGLRQLGFMKLFGLNPETMFKGENRWKVVQCSFDEKACIREYFGSDLVVPVRPGVQLGAQGPMNFTYQPKTETLRLECQSYEQNFLREIGRTFRMV